MRATLTRTVRKLSRTRARNQEVSQNRSGMIENATSASRQSNQKSTMTMPASSIRSPKMETSPAVNISFRASTSVVTRVTRRPSGFRS